MGSIWAEMGLKRIQNGSNRFNVGSLWVQIQMGKSGSKWVQMNTK